MNFQDAKSLRRRNRSRLLRELWRSRVSKTRGRGEGGPFLPGVVIHRVVWDERREFLKADARVK